MDFAALFRAMLNQTPLLPDSALVQIYLHASWAMVLATLLMGLIRTGLRRRLPLLEWALPGAVVFWVLGSGVFFLSSAVSPAYWLGLAFQTPSLMSTALALWLGMSLLLKKRSIPAPQTSSIWVASFLGVILGWLLLLDTFAVLPWGLYAIGFGTGALAVVGLLSLFYLAMFGKQEQAKIFTVVLACVVAAHVLLRLPTGNLWDALIDPWLWLVLHFKVLQGWRESKSTPF